MKAGSVNVLLKLFNGKRTVESETGDVQVGVPFGVRSRCFKELDILDLQDTRSVFGATHGKTNEQKCWNNSWHLHCHPLLAYGR